MMIETTQQQQLFAPVVEQSVIVKAYSGEEIRRFSFSVTKGNWPSLAQDLCKTFALENSERLIVKYTDDEGDMITISSDEELKEAITSDVGAPYLRLYVASKEHENPSPPSHWKWKVERKRWKEHCFKHQHQHQHQHQHLAKIRKKHDRHCANEWRRDRKDRLIARFVAHVTIPDDTEFAPNTAFTKVWRFRNEGSGEWPEGSALMFLSRRCGDLMGAKESIPVPGTVKPGEEIEVPVNMLAPSQPGRYVGLWRLCTPFGRKFGQRVWVKITVVNSDSEGEMVDLEKMIQRQHLEEAQQDTAKEIAAEPKTIAEHLKALQELGFVGDVGLHIALLKKYHGHIERVVEELLSRQNQQ